MSTYTARTIHFLMGFILVTVAMIGVGYPQTTLAENLRQDAPPAAVQLTTPPFALTGGFKPCNSLIPPGTKLYGALTPSGGGCPYIFQGAANSTITIRMTQLDGQLEPHLTLLTPGGAELAATDQIAGAAHSLIYTYRLRQGGLYTVIANGKAALAAGYFSLAVASNMRCGGKIGQEAVISAQFSPTAQYCLYTFTGAAGALVHVETHKLDGGSDPTLDLFDPRGVSLAPSPTATPDGAHLYQLPTDGSYTVLVNAQQDAAVGPFELSVLSGLMGEKMQQNCGSPIQFGDHLIDKFVASGEQCEYTFIGHANESITVHVQANSAAFRPIIDLIYPAGQVEAAGDAHLDGASIIWREYRLQSDGVYKIVVSPAENTSGAFALALSNGSFVPGQTVRNSYDADKNLINLRRTPGYVGKPASDILANLPRAATLTILGAATTVDKLNWWPVRYTDKANRVYTGWVAQTTRTGYAILTSDE